ncbi:MAG: hypothetical protein PHH82_00595 [Candidatus ainarchaeum sp.]|nr:hypothetical protein [Candidatus ainarchaeum sp.]
MDRLPRDKKSRENLEKVRNLSNKFLNEFNVLEKEEKKETKENSNKLKKELRKLNKRISEKNKKHMKSVETGKKEVSKTKKLLTKNEKRLKAKNKKMYIVAAKKKEAEKTLHETKLTIKDLEQLLKQKDDTIHHLKHKLEYDSHIETTHLKERVTNLEQKLKEHQLELVKKDTVIELLEKPEFDYSQLVNFDIRNIKTRHVGYPEVAQLEEITFSLQNIMAEPIKDLVCDVVVENPNRRFEMDNLQVKNKLNAKEKIIKTIHLYKHLKTRGLFKVTVWIKQKGQKVALVEQSKTINI